MKRLLSIVSVIAATACTSSAEEQLSRVDFAPTRGVAPGVMLPTLEESGITRVVVEQSDDRRYLDIMLFSGTEPTANLAFVFSSWSRVEDQGETWWTHNGYALDITNAEHVLHADVRHNGELSFAFDGVPNADGGWTLEEAPEGVMELQAFFGLVMNDPLLLSAMSGETLPATSSYQLEQANNGTAMHQYSRWTVSNAINHHIHEVSYWTDPQSAQTAGGWDCAFAYFPCPGSETKRIYHPSEGGACACSNCAWNWFGPGHHDGTYPHCQDGVVYHNVL